METDWSKLPDAQRQKIIEVSLRIAKERAEVLSQMKKALIRKQNDECIKLARKLCGLDE